MEALRDDMGAAAVRQDHFEAALQRACTPFMEPQCLI
jgi:hypothetical protein